MIETSSAAFNHVSMSFKESNIKFELEEVLKIFLDKAVQKLQFLGRQAKLVQQLMKTAVLSSS
jgi:hypothetical protein